MFKLNLKNELKVFFLLLFAVPVINILLFQGATSMLSATIIILSLLLFLVIALVNLERITAGMKEFERVAVQEEKKYTNITDSVVNEIAAESKTIISAIESLNLPPERKKDVKNAGEKLAVLINEIEEISAVRFNELMIDHPSRLVREGGKELELTPHEFELLWVFMNKKERVLSREFLLSRVWGYDYYGSTRSVDMAIARLRKKLGPCGSYIKTVIGFGYKFTE